MRGKRLKRVNKNYCGKGKTRYPSHSAVTCVYWENPALLERPEYGSGADVDIARKIAHSLCHGILHSNVTESQ